MEVTAMPKGNPTGQTTATEKYRKKMGIIAKNFKIKKELADQYAAACERAGVSQTGQIVELMQGFIDKVNAEHGE